MDFSAQPEKIREIEAGRRLVNLAFALIFEVLDRFGKNLATIASQLPLARIF